MTDFNTHLIKSTISNMSESRDVFSMMRNRLVDAQVSDMSSKKGMTDEKMAELRDQLQNQLKDAPSNQIVQQYIQLTGVGQPVEQPEQGNQ